MVWDNRGGGPWGSGPKGPWGGGSNQGGPTPPDLEDLLRKGQDRLKNIMPSGGSLSGKGLALFLMLAIGAWLVTGFYVVERDEQGIVLRFGKYVKTTSSGLHYHLPYPIEMVLLPKVTTENKIEIGQRNIEDARRGVVSRDVLEESLMLTGDENIVDIDFSVFWLIKPNGAGDFLFNIQNPEGTIKAVAESSMREVIGRSKVDAILTGGREAIDLSVQNLMQKTLDEYGSGVLVKRVQLQKPNPPQQVLDAFRDVQAARADAERVQNEAQTYANRIVPEARGRAAQILQSAEAYREQTVAEARGQASRFAQVLEQSGVRNVTRERLYLETMERVFSGMDKILIDQEKGQPNNPIVPYFTLDRLVRPQGQTPSGGNR